MAGRRDLGFTVGLLALAALVAGPVLAIAGIHGFDGLYGQDAFAYADYATGPLRTAILAGHAPPDFPLPPGYPLVVAAASVLLGNVDGIARGVALVAGAAVPVLVALLALEVILGRRPRLALLAGLVAAVAGQLWQSSLVTMSDTPALAAACFGAWSACRFHRTGRRVWLLLAAAALALAVETRLIYAVPAVVFGIVIAARLRADGRPAPGRAAISLVAGAAVGVLVLAPVIASIAAALGAGAPVPFAAEFGVAAFDPSTPFRSSFTTADGRLIYAWPMAAWYLLQPVHWYWLGAIGLAVPVGLGAILRRGGLRVTEGAALVAWPGLTFVVLVFYPYQNPRFSLALLPPVAILASVGLGAAVSAVAARRPSARPVVLAGLVVVFAVTAALAWRYADGFAARQEADLTAIRSLEARVPVGSSVVAIGATPALRHDGLAVTELYDLPETAARGIMARGPFYVVVDAAAIRTQWAGTPTGHAFDVLATAPGFTAIAQNGAWTLFASAR